MCPMMSAHQVRGTRSEAILMHRFGGGFGNTRIRCQTQIIVAAKGEMVATVDPDVRTLRGLEQTTATAQALPLNFGKFGSNVAHRGMRPRLGDRTIHRGRS